MNRPTSDILAADKAYRRADALTSIRDNIGPLRVTSRRRFEPRAPRWLVVLSWGGWAVFFAFLVAAWCGR